MIVYSHTLVILIVGTSMADSTIKVTIQTQLSVVENMALIALSFSIDCQWGSH